MRRRAGPTLLVGLSVFTALGGCGREAGPEPLTRPLFVGVIDSEPDRVFRGVFSPDGTEFYYFRKMTPGQEDYRVLRSRRAGGSWSSPELVELGDPSASSMYPALSPDGSMLAFSSDRSLDGASRGVNLWGAKRDGGGWGTPFPLRGAFTPGRYDAAPWFRSDDELHFSSTSPDWSEIEQRVATRISDSTWTLSSSRPGDLPMTPGTQHLWSVVQNRAGTLAVLELSQRLAVGGVGPSDLWLAERVGDDWSRPLPFGPAVNTTAVENFPTFLPDDSSVVFVRGFSGFHLIENPRAALASRSESR